MELLKQSGIALVAVDKFKTDALAVIVNSISKLL
jgi:hypothetical protein